MKTRKRRRKATKSPRRKFKGKDTGKTLNGFPIWTFKVKDLDEAPYNPRMISERALTGLRASVNRFGMTQPIIWNRRTCRLVGGHQRLKTLDEDETTEVTVVDLNEDEEKALNVALNNPNIMGEWTGDLGAILAEIEDRLPELGEDLLFGDLLSDFEDMKFLDDSPDDVTVPEPEEPPTDEDAQSKPGEIYQLGPHRLMCGDSTIPEDVARLMNGEVARLLATDPPYLVNYKGGNHPNHAGSGDKPDKHWDDYIDSDSGVQFYIDYLAAFLPHCHERVSIYQWHASWRHSLVEAAWKHHKILFHQEIIWAKTSGTLTHSDMLWRHEPCYYGWVKGKRPPKGRRPPSNATTVWDDIANERDGIHPTQKPIELFARPIRWHLRRGELCAEPFAGSGSCVMAAAVEGRVCYAMEKSEGFCDVIRKRWGEYCRANNLDPGNDAL